MSVTITPAVIAHLLRKNIRINVNPNPSIKSPDSIHGFEKFTNHSSQGFLPLGAYSYAHSYAREISEIGRYCSISSGISVIKNTHPTSRLSSSPVFYSPRKLGEWGQHIPDGISLTPFHAESAPVTMGSDVWIGQDVRIRSGVHIATGAIVAAGSIVTRDVEPYAIVGGVPAKVIRYQFEPDLIEKLLASEWWQFSPKDLLPYRTENPEQFLDQFSDAKDTLTPLNLIRLNPRQHIRRK
jgi:virginiamycin A acetyltransferase